MTAPGASTITPLLLRNSGALVTGAHALTSTPARVRPLQGEQY
jgi:hypothetical protein